MMPIERLTHLATDGDPSAEAHANRERRRRGLPLVWFACPLLLGDCGGMKHDPPMTTLEELRDWAEVEFFADGLRATIEAAAFAGDLGVYLRKIDAPPRSAMVGCVWLSADGRPRFRFSSVVIERSNDTDFCTSRYLPYNPDLAPLSAPWACERSLILRITSDRKPALCSPLCP